MSCTGADDAGGGELREGIEGEGGFRAWFEAAGGGCLCGRWVGLGRGGFAGGVRRLHGLAEGEQGDEGGTQRDGGDSEGF
ncbi:MAG TPA: hypothetical protein VK814_11100 [Acidobacteriaceae bacterium]|nr:hypothetical protein [Acidobacteriaceae bacterium]